MDARHVALRVANRAAAVLDLAGLALRFRAYRHVVAGADREAGREGELAVRVDREVVAVAVDLEAGMLTIQSDAKRLPSREAIAKAIDLSGVTFDRFVE